MSDQVLKGTKNDNLGAAKKNKNDEFYTQYHDIEKEMNAYLDYDENVFRDKTILLPCDDPEWSNFTKYFAQNFERLGLKKLISTSYAPDSKPQELNLQLTLFETQSPKFDKVKARANGKIYTLTRDTTGDQKVNVEDLEWEYLKGDGDFRSAEVTALRDEADIVITNPPFSLFRDFLQWIVAADKRLVVLGNQNAITYKDVFRLIQGKRLWLGPSISSGDREFRVPDSYPVQAAGWRIDEHGAKYLKIKGIRWFTNLDHGRRHEPLILMSETDNIKFNKKLKGNSYQKYDNYDAIEVSFTDAIPSDYPGMMGVPITFLDKYNPDQFNIVGMCENEDLYQLKTRKYASAECKAAYLAKFKKPGTYDLNASGVLVSDGQYEKVYQRILVRHKGAA
jgi:hypothetical protein